MEIFQKHYTWRLASRSGRMAAAVGAGIFSAALVFCGASPSSAKSDKVNKVKKEKSKRKDMKELAKQLNLSPDVIRRYEMVDVQRRIFDEKFEAFQTAIREQADAMLTADQVDASRIISNSDRLTGDLNTSLKKLAMETAGLLSGTQPDTRRRIAQALSGSEQKQSPPAQQQPQQTQPMQQTQPTQQTQPQTQTPGQQPQGMGAGSPPPGWPQGVPYPPTAPGQTQQR